MRLIDLLELHRNGIKNKFTEALEVLKEDQELWENLDELTEIEADIEGA